MKGFLSFLEGATLGGVLGAAIALLLAPESGEELRSGIRERKDLIQDEMKQASALRRAELEQQLAVMRAPRKADEV